MSSVVTGETGAVSTVSTPSTPQSAPTVVEVEALLAPIPGENPAGESLQYSGLYDEIREARREEDNLAQGDWQREPKLADWPKVVALSSDALVSKTKDLQICAWMNEALVELYGFVGLRDGLHVMRGLHEQFWDKAYPEMEEGDMEARANALAWMDRQLSIPIKEIPLTKSSAGVDYTYLQWEDSTKFDIPDNLDTMDGDARSRFADLKAQAEAEGKTTGEMWRKAKGATRRAFYEETYALLNECWQEFQALDRVMDEKFQRQTPGLSTLKKSLDDIRTLVEKVVKEKRILEPDSLSAGEAATDGGAAGEEGATGGRGLTGPVRSRADALRRLEEVAAYFQQTEPHSPVAYLVQRAIKWGQMPLELWLQDVIKDNNVLGQLRETLGLTTNIKEKEDEQGG
ncbi:MAG: hypothetical protein AUG51_23360 [Acidobacteria bacterium 13_1_20CM_3_53_8]|nr:MAG: hypothetical protein AUG51_23360 [Acidobacteria bacterium 13_1_20CM_3_53_8]